jgi:hypothetical protein
LNLNNSIENALQFLWEKNAELGLEDFRVGAGLHKLLRDSNGNYFFI